MVTTLILLAILAKWPGLLRSEKLKNFIERYTKKKSGDAFMPQPQPGKYKRISKRFRSLSIVVLKK